MARRLTAVSLVVCLLVSLLTVAPVAAQEDDSVNVEFIDCETVRITGDAGYAEVGTSFLTKRGEIDTEVQSIELTGNETVLSEDDLYPGGVGSYQGEFVIDNVGLFESSSGPLVEDFSNPNSQSCFDSLPRPSETTTPPTATETTTPPDAGTTTAPTTGTTSSTTTDTPATTTTASDPGTPAPTRTETTTPATTSQNTAPPPTSQNPEPAPNGNTNDGGAEDDVGAPDRTTVPFAVNASSGANETLVTYNVTGTLVNATDSAAVTANGSEQAPNGTLAPTVEADGFEALSYLAVNSTADETTLENLSVVATVNSSYLSSLDANASDVQLHAWDADNDTWIPLNTSVGNATNASQTSTVNTTNASHVFEATSDHSVYALGLNRSHVVVTEVTAPENVSVGETFTVEATVENTGRANGTHAATLSAAGTPVEETEVALGANESTTVRFDWRFETPGTHTVAVGGSTAEVTVTAAGESVSPEEGDTATDSTSAPQLEQPESLSRLGVGVLAAPLVLAGGALVALRRA